MTPFERAVSQLSDFCLSKTQRIYALKGPWGAGKSYLVRHFLKTHKQVLPTCEAYVSVFGLRTVQEVQERINGSIEYSRLRPLGLVGRAFSALLSAAGSIVPSVGFKLPDFSNSAFWYIAKQKGILIVIDDLERSPELEADKLFGLASSITENSQAKVLFVFNDDEFTPDNKEQLTKLREKVIDGEYAFHPEIRDLVKEYFADDSLTETVVRCLEAKGGPNIRRILRIRHRVADFRKAMTKANIRFDDADLKQVAKMIWLFDVAPIPLSPHDRVNLSIWSAFGGLGVDVEEQAENRTAQLARKVEMIPNTFDDLVLKCLQNGYYSASDLGKFADEDNRRRHDETLEMQVAQVIGLFNENFRASEVHVIDAVKCLLEKSFQELELHQFMKLAWLLSVSGQGEQAQIWKQKYLDAVLPTANEATCKVLLEAFGSNEHVSQIRQRLAQIRPEVTVQQIIKAIAKDRSWNSVDLERLNALADGFYRHWFEEAEGDLFEPISGILRLYKNSESSTPEGRFRQKLENVLRMMAGESRINQNRVRTIFHLEPSIENVVDVN